MDDLGVGRLIMLARQRKQWRQEDLAAAAGVSRALVALAEAGALERLTLRSVRRIAAPLEVRLPFTPLWNGGEVDRLRDRDHARLVDEVTTVLTQSAWEVVVEYTFSHYGESIRLPLSKSRRPDVAAPAVGSARGRLVSLSRQPYRRYPGHRWPPTRTTTSKRPVTVRRLAYRQRG